MLSNILGSEDSLKLDAGGKSDGERYIHLSTVNSQNMQLVHHPTNILDMKHGYFCSAARMTHENLSSVGKVPGSSCEQKSHPSMGTGSGLPDPGKTKSTFQMFSPLHESDLAHSKKQTPREPVKAF
jgi:hypothetical protein